MEQKQIQKYAKLLVEQAVNLKKGEKLRIGYPLQAIDLVREMVNHAYKIGALDVKCVLNDDKLGYSRLLYGSDEAIEYFGDYDVEHEKALVDNEYHRIALVSFSDPNPDVSIEKLSTFRKIRDKKLEYVHTKVMSNDVKWVVAPCVTDDWAKIMYPDISIEEAREKLFDDLMKIMRIDNSDVLAAWKEHEEELKYRITKLNGYKFDKLLFSDGGTELEIGLALDAIWTGGNSVYKDGNEFMANVPTEEVFTMPHKMRVNGHAVIRKPFILYDKVVTGLELDFKDGAIVNFTVDNNKDLVEKFLNTDEGSKRLGEVALVDKSSPINSFDRPFFDTLIDENAASHIAIGAAYDENTTSKLSKDEIGWNESMVHEDIMIGSDNMSVIGVTCEGKEVHIMKDGSFTDEFRK